MIEYLIDILTEKEDSSNNTQTKENRDYFNKRLIKSEVIEDFNSLYERFYKCLFCNDVIFNPIHCYECQQIFCKSCVPNISNNNVKGVNFICNHTMFSKDLPSIEKVKFEKVKVNCFFKCSNENLNLLNYPSHLNACITKNNIQNSELSSKNTDTKINSVSNHLEMEFADKFKQLKEKLSSKLNEKDTLIKSLQTKLVQLIKESFAAKQLSAQMSERFIELEEIFQKNEKNLEDINDKLKIKTKEVETLKKILEEEKEIFFKVKADLLNKIDHFTIHLNEFEKKHTKLIEDKNKLLMFNSTSQNLSENEIAFREMISQTIDPDLSTLNLSNKNLEDIHIKYLSQCQFLNNLTSLDLQNNPMITIEGFNYLKDSCFINTLQDFKLCWSLKGKEGLIALQESNFLDKLTVLDLSSLEFKDDGLKAFSKCVFLHNLISLDLSNNDLSHKGFKYLIDSNFLNNLSNLNLAKNKLNDIRFKDYNCLFNVTHLDLSDNNITSIINFSNIFQKLKSLFLSKNKIEKLYYEVDIVSFPKLTKLNLSECKIKSHGIKELLNIDVFDNLTELNLNKNNLSDDCLYKLSDCKKLTRLENLILSRNDIEASGIHYLETVSFKSLINLDLSVNDIGNTGLGSLSKCCFKSLKVLNLSECNFGKEGIAYLINSGFTSLTQLDFSSNKIEDEGMESLSKCGFRYLTYLNLNDVSIDKVGIEFLAKSCFRSLTQLILTNNNIFEKDEKEICELLTVNFKSLVVVNLANSEEFNDIGYKLWDESKIDEAASYFKKAIKINPKSMKAIKNLAIMLTSDYKAKEAEEYISKAIELGENNPKSSGVQFSLGYLYSSLKKYKESEDHYKLSIKLDPNIIGSYTNLGFVLRYEGKYKEAVEYFKKANELYKKQGKHYDDYYHYQIARCQKGGGKYDDAYESYIKAIEFNPKNNNAHYYFGVLLDCQGKTKEAEEQYRAAIEINSTDCDYYMSFGVLLEKQGRDKEAEELIRKGIDNLPYCTDFTDGDFYNVLAKILEKQGREKEADESFRKAIEVKPNVCEFYDNLAKLLQKQGRVEEADEYHKRAKKLYIIF